MSYKVLKSFRDKEDELFLYKKGDSYPREGYEPAEERIEELSSRQNQIKQNLIIKVEVATLGEEGEAETFPKHLGGGNYELSNGDKIKGKEKALETQSALENEKEKE